MFAEIQKYKKLGLKKSQAAKKLEIDFKTISKYWNMSIDEYAALVENAKERLKKLDKYKEPILEWLNNFRDMTASQVYDWLLEQYEIRDISERTVRLYVGKLRKENNLDKSARIRQYEEVPQLPMGYQGQVDLGQIILRRNDGSKVKLYCFAIVLSHSRYKYSEWSEKPFTTISFTQAHERAFEYFGGIPVELVYDQDRLLAVNENFGDVIYTEGFQRFIDVIHFKVRLCRGYDPESKGKIEAVVKYIKYNFADHRYFCDIESFNEDTLKWLKRTGNAKEHEMTKKIPAEVFEEEKKHLKPFEKTILQKDVSNKLVYPIRKNNTVLYKQNRYQVPKGTYVPGKNATLVVNNLAMTIVDCETGEIIAEHILNPNKGDLVRLKHVERDMSESLKALLDRAINILGQSKNAIAFTEKLRVEKSRYFRDQLKLIVDTCSKYETDVIEKALKFCIEKQLYSAPMLRDAIEYLLSETKKDKKPVNEKWANAIPSNCKGIIPVIRDISEYSKAFKEGSGKWIN